MQNLNKKMNQGFDNMYGGKFKARDKTRKRSKKKPATQKNEKESKEPDKKEDEENSNKEGGSRSRRGCPDRSDQVPTGGNNFNVDSDSS